MHFNNKQKEEIKLFFEDIDFETRLYKQISAKEEQNELERNAEWTMRTMNPQWDPSGLPQYHGGIFTLLLLEMRNDVIKRKISKYEYKLKYAICKKFDNCLKRK